MDAEVGPTGGALSLDEVRVEIPAGALDATVALSLCPAMMPEGFEGAGSAWELVAEEGLALTVAATVVLDGVPEGVEVFVPGADGIPEVALQAVRPFPQTLEAPLFRAGVGFLGVDDRERETYRGSEAWLDVLFVVDDSASMDGHQETLVEAFREALPSLLDSGVDFRAGVVTTDLDDPSRSGALVEARGVRWVGPTTPDAADVFERLARVGERGSLVEQGIGAAYLAMDVLADTDNAGFQRDFASLAVVVVSDEDDQTAAALITPEGFTDWLLQARPAPAASVLHAIVHPPGGGFSEPPGTRYLEVADATGGEMLDIEHNSWSRVFDRLIEDGLQSSDAWMDLALLADPESVEAWWLPQGAEQVRLGHAWVDNQVEVELGGAAAEDVVILYRAL